MDGGMDEQVNEWMDDKRMDDKRMDDKRMDDD